MTFLEIQEDLTLVRRVKKHMVKILMRDPVNEQKHYTFGGELLSLTTQKNNKLQAIKTMSFEPLLI